jgi:hypothetical protein
MTEILAITIAFVALIVSVITFFLSHRRTAEGLIDNFLYDIQKLNIEHPTFNDPEFTNNFPDIEDYKLLHQYDVFGSIIWNFFESMFDRKLHNYPSLEGTFKYWTILHKKW